ncbi:hypothetical protein HG263_19645 [Pseudoalteromonas sp. JBTF-M23]|uniref:Uncharacterized protein n=1 Tax=Pseudoalteromonas caenipelagi TaxID=2726988 RepID=A0A849VLV2_9GAMM|nr:hypothetical protein [Pseudoalteromonas caenipelagi]NOU52724.1 hypothetical protein [Pseudoalteromonas caenipelagi]
MRFIFAAIISLLCSVTYANQWHSIDASTWLVSPSKSARYIQENQAIIVGKHCAAIINAHGDFVALENMINTAKQKLQIPVCYLVSTSADTQQVIGMAMLQRAFPSAKWYVGQAVFDNFSLYQQALEDKLALHRKSLTLSTKRLSQVDDKQQIQKHIDIAKQRLDDWQNLGLSTPQILPKQTQTALELGAQSVILSAVEAFSSADIFVFNPANGALIGGNSVDPLPEVRHEHISHWLEHLNTLKTDSKVSWLLPAHGKPYKKQALELPITFFEALNKGLSTKEVKQRLSSKYGEYDAQTKRRLIHYYQLAQRRIATKAQDTDDVVL